MTSQSSSSEVERYRRELRTHPAIFWQKKGEQRAVTLFHEVAESVPAYKHFLKKHHVKPEQIRTITDFKKIPFTTKHTYIQEYSLEERSWGGKRRGHSILAMSSGTSGLPTLWPRGEEQEKEATFIHEFLFTDLFNIEHRSTLAVVCFPMGVYVSGVATTLPLFSMAAHYPNFSIATAGNDRTAASAVLETTGQAYEQIILIGHPFFIKDLLEHAKQSRASWLRSKIRLMTCSEGFNETWRTYVAAIIKADPYADIISTYGSSEFLLTGFENPQTIAIRREAEKRGLLREALFTETPIVPNLFQYNPVHRFIECEGENLVLTANTSAVPLIRYNQFDHGFVLLHEQVTTIFSEYIQDDKKNSWKPWKLPYVGLYGRSDRTMVFYAANLYPEHIQAALNKKEHLSYLTGKFVMEKKYTETLDQKLLIHIELRPRISPSKRLASSIQKDVVRTLELLNMEYRFLRHHLPVDLAPIIDLHVYQDPTYFKPGLKPRYLLDRTG